MRKSVLLFSFVTIVLSLPLQARSRHESYVSFEEGGAVILQAGDDRGVEARVNLPVFPGDELRTERRGRLEIRLADGNVVALDRDSAIRFDSIYDSYEREDGEETVAVLDFGAAIVHRLSWSKAPLRLDTPRASYISTREAIFSIESDGRGSDVLSVFDGTVEVRTRNETEEVSAGEEAKVDDDGVYASNSLVRDGSTDFERWYLRRADRYSRSSSRYLGSRFAYYDYELDSYGSWVYVDDYSSWVWRPRVSVGWRPYYHGRWGYGPTGTLVWISDEPWGWLPYHYGRWAYQPFYGWVWLPGYTYSPAWVYWAYGPNYIGWVPAGWYDCYPHYYGWAYRPTFDIGLGFYGRVRFGGVDLGGWTFLDSHTLLSTRVDRAALTTDAIKDRLVRGGDVAVVSSKPTRFGRDGIKDPAAAVGVIHRGAVGGGTGRGGSGSLTDLTEFIRRDPELPNSVRDRITRPRIDSSKPESGGRPQIGRDGGTGTRGDGNGVVPRDVRPGRTPSADNGGSVPRAPRGTGDTIDRTPRGDTPRPRVDRTPNQNDDGDTIDRTPKPERQPRVDRTPKHDDDGDNIDRTPDPERQPRVERPGSTGDIEWRNRPVRREPDAKPTPRKSDNWRSGGRTDSPSQGETASPRPRASRESDDTPRRVIDRIGGARVERPQREAVTPRAERPRSSDRSVDRPAPRSERSGSSSTRDSGSSSPRSSGSVDRGSSGSSKSSSGSSSRSSSGSGKSNIKRD